MHSCGPGTKSCNVFFGMLETWADPNIVSVMICIKKSTVMNVQGLFLGINCIRGQQQQQTHFYQKASSHMPLAQVK